MNNPGSSENFAPSQTRGNIQQWWITPLLSALGLLGAAIGFFVLFCHFANNIELDKFAWWPVLTNIAAANNSPQTQGGHPSDFSTALQGSNVAPAKTKQPTDRLTRELSLRMFWAISAVIFAALCFAVVIYAIQIVRYVFDGSPANANWGTVIFSILAIIAFIYLLKGPPNQGAILNISGGNAAEELFQFMGDEQNSNQTGADRLLRDKNMPALHSVRDLTSFASASSKLGLAFVGIVAAVVLAVMRKEQDEFANLTQPADTDAAAKKTFNDKVDAAKFRFERWVEITVSLLQLTACALVAGVVEVYLLYNMASYYVNPLLQNDIQSYAQGLATVSGLVYSALLIAIYLPLVSGQRAIGRELINCHGGDKINGKDTTFVAQLADTDPKKAPMIAAVLTVFSPVLVAFLTALASSLTELFSH